MQGPPPDISCVITVQFREFQEGVPQDVTLVLHPTLPSQGSVLDERPCPIMCDHCSGQRWFINHEIPTSMRRSAGIPLLGLASGPPVPLPVYPGHGHYP